MGRSSMPSHCRRRTRRAGRRAADRRAGARPSAGRGCRRSGGRCGAGAEARAMGRPLVAAGRGRWRDGFGSTSAALRICSAASAGWSRIFSAVCALGLTARVAIAPTAGAAWALARFIHPFCDFRESSRKDVIGTLRPPCTLLPCASMPTRCGRSNGWGSRRSAHWLACHGSRWRGGFGEPRTSSMRSTGHWAEARAADRRAGRSAAARGATLEEPATHPEAASQRSNG